MVPRAHKNKTATWPQINAQPGLAFSLDNDWVDEQGGAEKGYGGFRSVSEVSNLLDAFDVDLSSNLARGKWTTATKRMSTLMPMVIVVLPSALSSAASEAITMSELLAALPTPAAEAAQGASPFTPADVSCACEHLIMLGHEVIEKTHIFRNASDTIDLICQVGGRRARTEAAGRKAFEALMAASNGNASKDDYYNPMDVDSWDILGMQSDLRTYQPAATAEHVHADEVAAAPLPATAAATAADVD